MLTSWKSNLIWQRSKNEKNTIECYDTVKNKKKVCTFAAINVVGRKVWTKMIFEERNKRLDESKLRVQSTQDGSDFNLFPNRDVGKVKE